MLEVKVTTKKSPGFYVRAVATFVRGTSDKPPVEELQISGLGSAVGTATAVAARVEQTKLAKITKIQTDYVSMESMTCPQVVIQIKALPQLPPLAIVLRAEVKQECVDEFIKVMTDDAVSTRAESGYVRFDFLRNQSNPRKFTTYEVFKDADAIDAHKQQPAVKAWGAFQYSDKKPLDNKVVSMTHAINFQSGKNPMLEKPPTVVVRPIEAKEESVDEFLEIANKYVAGTRTDPDCIRCDLLRGKDNGRMFFIIEAWRKTEAITVNYEKPHGVALSGFPVVSNTLEISDGINFEPGKSKI